MIDPSGIDQAAKQIADKALEEGAGKAQEAKADDVERFQGALQGSAGEGQGQAQAGTGVQPAKADGPKSVGDSILEGMERMRTDYKETVEQVQGSVSGEGLKPEELLKVQMQLQKVTMAEELTSKVASKATQSLDTLLKNS